MLHPDKKPSVVVDSAFKLIQLALDVLTTLEKKEAYNKTFNSKKTKTKGSSRSRPQPPTVDDGQQFSRDVSHKATNASSRFKKPKP